MANIPSAASIYPIQGTRDKHDVSYYEGLCLKTASMYEPYVEEEYEDIVQILRVKAWRALQTYDATRSSMPVDRYVFSCVKNQCKDLLKRKRRNWAYIEEIISASQPAQDRFDRQYRAVDRDEAYFEVEEELLQFLPESLTDVERSIITALVEEDRQCDAQKKLGLTKAEVDDALVTIRGKMASLAPPPLAIAA